MSHDIVVLSEVNPDLVLTHDGDVVFGQVESLVGDARLTIGGSGTIFSCGTARLGLATAVAGLVGDDVFGRFMIEELACRGVDVTGIVTSRQTPTGVTVIVSRPDGDRAILTYPGTMTGLRAAYLDPDLLAGARHIHVSSVFLQHDLRPDLPRILAGARRRGATTSIDPNWDPYGDWSRTLEPLLDSVDVLLPNENEALAITGRATWQEALADLAARVPQVVLKRGAEGAVVATAGRRFAVPAPATAVVDTTGAGDSFDGGYLLGLLQGRDPTDRLRLAVACGSISTRSLGGTTGQATRAQAESLAATLPCHPLP